MTETKASALEVYRSAILDNEDALAVALALLEKDYDPGSLGLRVEILDGGRCRLVDPVVRSKGRGKAQDFHGALVGAMQIQLKQGVARQAYNSATMEVSAFVPFPQAAFALVARSMPGPPPEALPDEMMLFVPEGAQAAGQVADAMRLGRNATLLTARDMKGATVGSLVRLTDAAAEYGLASSMTGRNEAAAGMRPLARHLAGSTEFWIDVRSPAPRASILVLLDRFCQMQAPLAKKDFAWIDDGRDRGLLVSIERIDEAVPLDTLAGQGEPVQSFSLTQLSAMPDREAAQTLARRIADESHRLGYRVSLQPVPRDVSAALDIGPLVEQIEDLKLQIAQINALGAPQMRLLRFTDAQFPAMIDALRRLPPERLRDGSLLYAAGHSAGRAEPAHYLLHDFLAAPVTLHEALWREFLPARPINYWLEPFIAEQRRVTRTETLVFVPDQTFLVPSLAHFGGEVDSTLRLVIGNLFSNIRELLERPGSQPLFLFTPLEDREGDLEVEVVDRRSFTPLHQSLGWMNDYLQVRSPALINRETLRLMAEELYEGDFVQGERQRLEATVAGLHAEWQSAVERVRDESVALVTEHATEIEVATGQIERAQVWLREAEVRMRGLESLLQAAAKALQYAEAAEKTIDAMDDRMIRVREQFLARVETEVVRGEANAEHYSKRLERLRARIRALREELGG